MKKIISTSITALLLTAAGASADTYFFSGTGTTDFNDVSNWYKITSEKSPWTNKNMPAGKEAPLYTDSYTGEKLNNSYTYANATQLPTENDDIVFGIYYFAEQDTTSYANIPALKDSITVKNFLYRTHRSPKFVLGNSDESAAGSEFILKTKEDLYDVYNNTGDFIIDANAKQSAFRMQIGGKINSGYDNGKCTNFGSASRGFDSIEADSVIANIHFGFFAKKLIVHNSFAFGSNLTNGGKFTSSFNFIDLKDGEVAVSVGGKLSKSEDYKINLDFTNANLGEGESYTLVSAGSLEGFDLTDYTKDFNLIGIDAADIKSLAWNGNSLVLTTVPEPAAIAAVLGAIALGFAAYRRRK